MDIFHFKCSVKAREKRIFFMFKYYVKARKIICLVRITLLSAMDISHTQITESAPNFVISMFDLGNKIHS